MSFPCGKLAPRPHSRREMLARCAGGFGAMALAALLADGESDRLLAADGTQAAAGPFAPRPRTSRPRLGA